MTREIFMQNSQYLHCEEIRDTAGDSPTRTLEHEDCLLMFHKTKGNFIARQSMGCWCETDATQLFHYIKRLLEDKRNV